MRPKKPETTAEGDPFLAKLDQIINLKHEQHELVQLGEKIDWRLEQSRDCTALQRQKPARD